MPLLAISLSSILAVGAATFGARMVVDRPRSLFYDDIEPVWEGIEGIGPLDPRALPSCHYRVTTLHREVVKVERLGPWEVERGIDGWAVLKLHRNSTGVVERIDVYDDAEHLLATEEMRREEDTVFATTPTGVEERDLDAKGRIIRIRERGSDGKIAAAASIKRDAGGRVIQRTQFFGTGRIEYDASYEYGDDRFPARVSTERDRRANCAVKTTTFDAGGRREEVSCFDSEETAAVDPVSGCEVARYRYQVGTRTLSCKVGEDTRVDRLDY